MLKRHEKGLTVLFQENTDYKKATNAEKLTLSDWSHCNSAGPPNGPHNVIHPSRTQSPGNTLIDSSRRHSSASAQADLSIMGIWI